MKLITTKQWRARPSVDWPIVSIYALLGIFVLLFWLVIVFLVRGLLCHHPSIPA